MGKMESFSDDSLSLSNGMLRIQRCGQPPNVWTDGEYIAPNGTVLVYRQADRPYTRLDIAHAGRLHIRTWNEWFGDRTLTRLSKAFLADVANRT